MSQVTPVEADAADETAIAKICKQALQDEGQLDVFFANVCVRLDRQALLNNHIPTGWFRE